MKELIKKYPNIFKKYEGNPFNVNWDCPYGWLEPLDWLCGSIEEYLKMMNELNNRGIPQVTCTQVKEKYGMFEFYYQGGDDAIEGMVEMTQYICGLYCQDCGNGVEVEMRSHNGWVSCLCENCYDKLINGDNKIIENKLELIDWNKLTLDDLSSYLENKYKFSSSGEAKAIFELIKFYKKSKK